LAASRDCGPAWRAPVKQPHHLAASADHERVTVLVNRRQRRARPRRDPTATAMSRRS
jgi:hypothetical protein